MTEGPVDPAASSDNAPTTVLGPALSDRANALSRICTKLNDDIAGLSRRLAADASASSPEQVDGSGNETNSDTSLEAELAEANENLERAISERRVQRLRTRSLAEANDRLRDEVDQVQAGLRRSERRVADLTARNESLEGARESSLDLHMQLLQANARLKQLGARLDNERTRTRFAQEQAARLRRELAIARVASDHPPQAEQAS